MTDVSTPEDSSATESASDGPEIAAALATIDPVGDAKDGVTKNRARVGTARPSALLYTSGPGSVMDLPRFSIMPVGLEDWAYVWKRLPEPPQIIEPRLLEVVRVHLGDQVDQLRPFPWRPQTRWGDTEADDVGVPARVFPQWFRCTGCNYLGPIDRFSYSNTNPYRPDLARFVHKSCPRYSKKSKGSKSKRESPAVPAQYLLTCVNGHLDEFPYDLWVHHGGTCPKAQNPDLKMLVTSVGGSMGATIACQGCEARRSMAQAQGSSGKDKIPQTCRGRHPHLGVWDAKCDAHPAIIMMGASNIWFPTVQSVIVMPRTEAEDLGTLADQLRAALDPAKLAKYADNLDFLRDLVDEKVDLSDVDDAELEAAVAEALAPAMSEEERQDKVAKWDPAELLIPEWNYLQKPSLFPHQENTSGLMVTEAGRDPDLHPRISRIVAVNKMKKVNAFIGFTRLDELDRVGDRASRLVRLTRKSRPTWVPATEDRGEGIFIQLDAEAVDTWEKSIESTTLWAAHRAAFKRNFDRRFSETAGDVDPDSRLPSPRYWLLHTLSHVLLREMAMSCGYGAASLSERIYGWAPTPERPGAAGFMIFTTASDSEGTLGGLVALSAPTRFRGLVVDALRRAGRCSSDPVCAMRVPRDPEDFLHGAACHCCTFASETSCERSNRFLDRRFLINLPSTGNEEVTGFFGTIDER